MHKIKCSFCKYTNINPCDTDASFTVSNNSQPNTNNDNITTPNSRKTIKQVFPSVEQ